MDAQEREKKYMQIKENNMGRKGKRKEILEPKDNRKKKKKKEGEREIMPFRGSKS